MKSRKITNVAPNKKTGLTLHDLVTFIQDCHDAGIGPWSRIQVGVGWRGQIQEIEAEDVADS